MISLPETRSAPAVAADPAPAVAAVAADPAPAVPAVAAAAAGLVPLAEIAPAIAAASVSRRRFLGFGLAIVGGLAGATALSRLFPIFDEPAGGPPPIVPAYDPATKRWTFVVDTGSCIGCGLCVVACKEENQVTEDARFARTWVERHAETTDGARYVDSPEGGIDGFPPASTAPGAEGKTIASAFFEPRLCMQCEEPPCTAVCPVGATYKTEDGIVLVDPRRCIGCGYCVVACPYGARYIAPAADRSPNDTPGVADKCTWCYHRISRGDLPACVEVCPVGARTFGNAADPKSEIAAILRERLPEALHPEFGTKPRVLYLGPSVQEA
jgi:Fe-S-cluster-containing dehydrogenase component